MANSPYDFDATADNFHKLVLENSDKGPVLVNYWSPHAGPCMMLMARLIRLATEFGGGKVVGTLHGTESKTMLRVFISKHVSRQADGIYASALQAYQRGDPDKAVTQAA